MCQCLLCDCWWCNCCGICCAGWHAAFCCLSCWLCKPIEMINPDCCNVCMCTGYGGNFLCYGNVMCAPDYVKDYSRFRTSSPPNVIVVNQDTPLTTHY